MGFFSRILNNIKHWLQNLFIPTPPIIDIPREEPIVVEPDIGPDVPPVSNFTPTKYLDYYLSLWDSMVIRPEKESTISWYLNQIGEEDIERYKYVSERSGVPWQVIAAIHCLEGSFSFSSVLHNGEDLDDVNRRGTTLVPKGHGQGMNWTWEDAAIHALSLKDRPDVWDVPNTLYYLEKFNGLGYLWDSKKPHSPYLWSFTKHYFRGKYVSDGSYSATAVSKQIGAAVLLVKLDWKPE